MPQKYKKTLKFFFQMQLGAKHLKNPHEELLKKKIPTLFSSHQWLDSYALAS